MEQKPELIEQKPELIEQKPEQPDKIDFFVHVQSWVTAAYICSRRTGLYLGKTKREHIALTDTVVHNATVPADEKQLTLCLLGMSGHTSYRFNDLFSIPLNVKTLGDLGSDAKLINKAIVHTPRDIPYPIKFVAIRFPFIWRKLLKVPDIMFLYKVDLSKLSLPPKTKYTDVGLAPGYDNFVASVEMQFDSPEYVECLIQGGDSGLDKLMEAKIKVICYSAYAKLYLDIDAKGNTQVVSCQQCTTGI